MRVDLLLAACAADRAQAPAGPSPPAPAAVADARAESQRLHALVDEYFEQLEAKLGRWIDDREQAAGAGT